jgi:hypothetical protein
MPAEDRKANHPPRRGPRLPIHEDDYHQPEPAAELPAGVPAGLIELDESAAETPDAPKSAR